jgi:hypothetical protein
LINTLPLTIIGNTTLDVLYHVYSLSTIDFTTDATFLFTFNVYDATDLTTIVDTTVDTYTFQVINESFFADDSLNKRRRSKLHRHFLRLPVNGDTTIFSLGENNTISLLPFSSQMEYNKFLLRYVDQFAVLMNSVSGSMILLSRSYYDNNDLTLKYIVPASEIDSVVGFVYDYAYLFFSEI